MILRCNHSFTTICEYRWHFSQIVSFNVEDDRSVVGGPNIIVEIEENKFGSRKYYKGNRVEGSWIVSGVDKSTYWKIFNIVMLKHCLIFLKKYCSRVNHPHRPVVGIPWRYYLIKSVIVSFGASYYHSFSRISTNTIEGKRNWTNTNTVIQIEFKYYELSTNKFANLIELFRNFNRWKLIVKIRLLF